MRTSNRKEELARRRRYRAAVKPSEVIVKSSASFPRGLNNNPRGSIAPRRTKAANQIGDVRTMFGVEYVAFKGGEGGRNWSIPATKC